MSPELRGLERSLARSKALRAASARILAATSMARLLFVTFVSFPWLLSMVFRDASVSEVALWVIALIVGRYAATYTADRLIGDHLIAQIKAEFPEVDI